MRHLLRLPGHVAHQGLYLQGDSHVPSAGLQVVLLELWELVKEAFPG
jgi:hypothetical protein